MPACFRTLALSHPWTTGSAVLRLAGPCGAALCSQSLSRTTLSTSNRLQGQILMQHFGTCLGLALLWKRRCLSAHIRRTIFFPVAVWSSTWPLGVPLAVSKWLGVGSFPEGHISIWPPPKEQEWLWANLQKGDGPISVKCCSLVCTVRLLVSSTCEYRVPIKYAKLT